MESSDFTAGWYMALIWGERLGTTLLCSSWAPPPPPWLCDNYRAQPQVLPDSAGQDRPSRGQDDLEPRDYAGLDAAQRDTSASATADGFTAHFMLLWKLNPRSQIDGVRDINCDCLWKLNSRHCIRAARLPAVIRADVVRRRDRFSQRSVWAIRGKKAEWQGGWSWSKKSRNIKWETVRGAEFN